MSISNSDLLFHSAFPFWYDSTNTILVRLYEYKYRRDALCTSTSLAFLLLQLHYSFIVVHAYDLVLSEV